MSLLEDTPIPVSHGDVSASSDPQLVERLRNWAGIALPIIQSITGRLDSYSRYPMCLRNVFILPATLPRGAPIRPGTSVFG
jgi:hypothetical protein